MTVGEFAEAVAVFCYNTQGSITSWGRTARRNKAVGGNMKSYHLRFLGADVVYDIPLQLEQVQNLARQFGLKVVRETDHDHLQPLDPAPHVNVGC